MLIVCLKNFAVIYFGCVALILHELFYLVIFLCLNAIHRHAKYVTNDG